MLALFTSCGRGEKPSGPSSSDNNSGVSSAVSGEDASTPTDSDISTPSGEPGSAPDASGGTTTTQKGKDPAAKPTSKGVTTTTTAKTNERKLYDDVVENMGGYEFIIANPWMNRKAAENAGLVERLYHQRFAEVEKAYNCTIRITDYYAGMEALAPRIMAGDKVADVMKMLPEMWIPAAGAGYLRPWNDVFDIINENDTRWISSRMNAKLNNKNYIMEFERPDEGGATILWYNKDVLKAAGIKEDPAQLVLENKWTWAKFREMLKKTTDGKSKFGLIWADQWADPGRALAVSNGARSAVSSGGTYKTAFTDPKYLEAMNFFDQIVNVDKTMKVLTEQKSESTFNNMNVKTAFSNFGKGNIAFVSGRAWYGTSLKAEYENLNYGVVVYPKGPSADGYYSYAQSLQGYAMTSTNKDYKKSAKIFRAISRPPKDFEKMDVYESEVLSDYFVDGDAMSKRMLALSAQNGVVDVGYAVRTLNEALTTAEYGSISWGTGTVSSALQALKGVYDKDVQSTFSKLPK